MQVNGTEAIRMAVELESKGRKRSIMAWAIFNLLIVTGIAAWYLQYSSNANKWNSAFCDVYGCFNGGEAPIYDTYFYLSTPDQVTDVDKAQELDQELADKCDEDCFARGSRWTVIFAFNGVLLILIATNGLL